MISRCWTRKPRWTMPRSDTASLRLEAVLFDLDGLLVDTESCDYVSWRELYEFHGEELTLEAYCCHAGLYGSWDRLYGELAGRAGVETDHLHRRRLPRFEALVEELLVLSPGLDRLLSELEAHGAPCAVASSSDRDWIVRMLDGMGIRHRFAAVVSGEDVLRRKPAPDIYLQAAARLGAAPERAVALEDSAHGIASARAAGIRVVAVPNPVTARQDLSQADAWVPELGEITVSYLLGLIHQS